MFEVNEILEREFNKLKADLIRRYDEKGMRASGRFANSLRVEINENNAKLTGLRYAEQLEYGRRPTSSGSSSGSSLRVQILQWIQDKNITPRDGISIESLSYAIANKIHQRGWNRQGFGGVELISEVLTPERINSILDAVVQKNIRTFVDNTIKTLNRLNE